MPRCTHDVIIEINVKGVRRTGICTECGSFRVGNEWIYAPTNSEWTAYEALKRKRHGDEGRGEYGK